MDGRTRLQVLMREPLVHFLIIGVLVFATHSFWMSGQARADRTISVTSQDIQRLSTLWAGEVGQDPTPDDIKGMIAEYVREEVLYREALRLGLDRDDTIIRRRLGQKMTFLVQRDELVEQPTMAELRAAFEANPQLYARPLRISLTHVPFNFAQNGRSREAEMSLALSDLQKGDVDPRELGDPFLLARVHQGVAETELARLFGKDFSSDVFAIEPGSWVGPVKSRLAQHFVRVDVRTEGGLPAFEDVVEDVRVREIEIRKRKAQALEMEKLLDRYTVVLNVDPG